MKSTHSLSPIRLVYCVDPSARIDSNENPTDPFLIYFLFPTTTTARAATTSLSMAAESPELKKGVIAAMGLAVPTVFSSLATVATEGTSEWFGVDDTRLLAVLFVVHWGILTLWLQQYGEADEDEDFFGEIDYTGN
uniref:PSII 6.1 kDa protein n=1 Tax=Pseudo-nitzschia australis TaxID=44445 RepID=A0A7S4AC92_9STRA|eukprot:CAMPEP_0168207818 /NCGR_PEP_ID=MMETSP0140_2-20121125/1716_1 /TAXON_ID=44445 /ORGANISM="Pseudo-nitzschia australis, Strain 10249 10 AB" /LENGTH=135 /DNA_ID=CAMNT_0008134131 /DNA_START=352 /DNA_END=759 /DNA_ORIENTATION=+